MHNSTNLKEHPILEVRTASIFLSVLLRRFGIDSPFPVALFIASTYNVPIVVDMPRIHVRRQVHDRDGWDSEIMKAQWGNSTRCLSRRGPDSCLMLGMAIHCQTRIHPRRYKPLLTMNGSLSASNKKNVTTTKQRVTSCKFLAIGLPSRRSIGFQCVYLLFDKLLVFPCLQVTS